MCCVRFGAGRRRRLRERAVSNSLAEITGNSRAGATTTPSGQTNDRAASASGDGNGRNGASRGPSADLDDGTGTRGCPGGGGEFSNDEWRSSTFGGGSSTDNAYDMQGGGD